MFWNLGHKIVCQACSQLKPIKIKVPSDFLSCIELMKKLIETGGFEKASSNFDLEQPKTPDGYW